MHEWAMMVVVDESSTFIGPPSHPSMHPGQNVASGSSSAKLEIFDDLV